MDSLSLKSGAGRLREGGVARIHELRGAYDAEGNAIKPPKMTYRQIAAELDVSQGTVYNVVTGRTHVDDVPRGHPKYRP